MPDQIDRSELVGSVGSTRATSSHSHGEEISDSERVPTSLMEIAPILRLAKKIEGFNYRVAYLCRYHALEKAHKLDPNSSGHGVRLFKTALINRLRKDDEITKGKRQIEDEKTMGKRMGDAREMERFYKTYHDFIHALLNDDDEADGSQLTTDGILFDVAEAVHQRERDDVEVPAEFLRFYNDVEENTQIYVPYNILPLDPGSENQTIMSFPEIKAAVMALRSNVRNLPWPENQKNKRDEDMLDWLQTMFGFQNDNVSNQRENLVLLLANVQSRKFPNEEPPELEEGTLDTVMGNVLENYIRWYKFLDLKDSKWSPHIEEEKIRQRKLLYIGLYLLIWGEAANIRFMPECLCYIYHHMAFELFEMLERRVNEETRKPAKPAYGGEDEAFLKNVVTPIYQTIAKEAKRGRGGKHSEGRNYDDLNEYFWSKKTQCNRQKWIEETDHADFFSKEIAQGESENKPNTGDQERTEDEKSAEDIAPEDPEVKPLIDNVSKPITVTAGDGCVGKVNFVERRSFLHLFRSFDRMWTSYILCLQAMIIIAWNEDGDSEEDDVFNTVLSIFITTAILNLAQALVDIVLTWNALHSMTFYMQLRYLLKAVAAVIWAIIFSITYYTHNRIFSSFAIVIYLSSSMLMAVMFLCLFFRCHRKRLSQNKIVKLVMWWYQPRPYVGSGMHENAWSFIKYMMFWIFLLILKFGFSYYAELPFAKQIKPLVGPTKEIMRLHISVNRLPELFAPGKAMNNIVLVFTLWSPVILVYFMDTQIWYATLSTLVGSTIGAYQRLGEVQTLGMLRTRFQYLSGVFNDLLVPISKPPPPGVAIDQVKLNVLKEARFSQMWNKIITSFREEDLINNREMDLLLVPYWKKLDAKKEQDPTENEHQDPIRWPLFLLTSKIPVALEMTKDSNGKDSELRKRLRDDIYMTSAVNECYASFKILLNTLVVQEQDVLILDKIFTMIDNHIDIGTLITSVNWSVLPDLYDQFVELTDHLINRLYLLLTVKDSAMDVPSNLEARRRLTFFSNSLFMEIPEAPKIRNMLSFSALTPYHEEEVRFSILDLKKQNEDGISILFYLKKIFPDEWMNFLERVKCGSEKELLASSDYLKEKLSMWGSYRGQTLAKTVRGMMYYRKAFKLQAFFDLAKKEELMSGYKSTNPASERAILRQTFIHHATDEDLDKGYKAFISEGESESAKLLWAKCQALADMKFTYVVSCQQYSKHKRTGNPRAAEISRLMNRYPSLRVAYIDEVKKIRSDSKGNVEKIYYSALVKSDPQKYGHQVYNSRKTY
ncbi:unnamed protein product [Arabis nemorensis]|uniref:1,3-beta-glucan synthase n=1 Tax=Arabis nemorensis TaxID=586526 RepID=A0A565C1Q6_9BRAS|nr:unnamed protein product [Arabis nemorensis]